MGAHDALFARLRHQVELVKKGELYILTARELQGKIEENYHRVSSSSPVITPHAVEEEHPADEDSEKLNPSLRTAGEEEEVKVQMEPPVEAKEFEGESSLEQLKSSRDRMPTPHVSSQMVEDDEPFEDARAVHFRTEVTHQTPFGDTEAFNAPAKNVRTFPAADVEEDAVEERPQATYFPGTEECEVETTEPTSRDRMIPIPFLNAELVQASNSADELDETSEGGEGPVWSPCSAKLVHEATADGTVPAEELPAGGHSDLNSVVHPWTIDDEAANVPEPIAEGLRRVRCMVEALGRRWHLPPANVDIRPADSQHGSAWGPSVQQRFIEEKNADISLDIKCEEPKELKIEAPLPPQPFLLDGQTHLQILRRYRGGGRTRLASINEETAVDTRCTRRRKPKVAMQARKPWR